MRHLPLAVLLVAIAITGCGGGQGPGDQVRAVETKGVEALIGEHPERACKYMADHDKCIGAVVTLNSMKLEPQAALGVPDDWRDRIKRATVTINGARATLTPAPAGKFVKFVKRDGRWLVVN